MADANDLMRVFGDRAYEEARSGALPPYTGLGIVTRSNRHWRRVRREIGRRTGHSSLDTATRFLTDRR